MHSAAVERSPRLQRVLKLLRDGREYSTRQIVQDADVCAVNAIVAELRDNGYPVECRQVVRHGRRIWLYRLPGAQLDLFGKSGDPLSAMPATPAEGGYPAPSAGGDATPPPGRCQWTRDMFPAEG